MYIDNMINNLGEQYTGGFASPEFVHEVFDALEKNKVMYDRGDYGTQNSKEAIEKFRKHAIEINTIHLNYWNSISKKLEQRLKTLNEGETPLTESEEMEFFIHRITVKQPL